MRTVSYGAFEDTAECGFYQCSRVSDKLPLLINCAGNFSSSTAFTTVTTHGRLDFYFLYIVSGTLAVKDEERWIICKPGSFLFFPPGTKYSYRYECGEELDYLWVHFTGSDAEGIIKDYGFSIFPEVNSIKGSESITVRFRNILDAFATSDELRDRELYLLLDRFFLYLARKKKDSSSSSDILKKSIFYIHSSFNRSIRIPELAKIENLSVSRYNTLFRKIFNCSPTEYIAKLRLSSACELLSGTDLSVKEIALHTGYADPHFFSRVFRAEIGLSPSEYRKRSF